jgi:predicted esterase
MSAFQLADEARAAGNTLVLRDDLAGAVAHYTRGIRLLAPAIADDGGGSSAAARCLCATLHSNIAQCRLSGGDAVAAAAAAAAAKTLDPFHLKANFRHAAAIMLQENAALNTGERVLTELRVAIAKLSPADKARADAVAQACRMETWLSSRSGGAAIAGLGSRIRLVPEVIFGTHIGMPACAGLTFRHSPDGADENLLILLHGLGDTDAGFGCFGHALALPQTAVLALRAPLEVPLLGGGMWFDCFDAGTMEHITGHEPSSTAAGPQSRRQATMAKTVDAICAALHRLHASHGVTADRIHLMGMGDGGAVALHVARLVPVRSVTALCASLLPEALRAAGAYGLSRNEVEPNPHASMHDGSGATAERVLRGAAAAVAARTHKSSSPADVGHSAGVPALAAGTTRVLLLHSARDGAYRPQDVAATAALLEQRPAPAGGPGAPGGCAVRCVRWDHRGPGAPASAAEMRPLMEHLAASLSRRLVALEDDHSVIQVGRDATLAIVH